MGLGEPVSCQCQVRGVRNGWVVPTAHQLMVPESTNVQVSAIHMDFQLIIPTLLFQNLEKVTAGNPSCYK